MNIAFRVHCCHADGWVTLDDPARILSHWLAQERLTCCSFQGGFFVDIGPWEQSRMVWTRDDYLLSIVDDPELPEITVDFHAFVAGIARGGTAFATFIRDLRERTTDPRVLDHLPDDEKLKLIDDLATRLALSS